jgi:hypothetical protein
MKKYLFLLFLFPYDTLLANCKCSGVPKVTISQSIPSHQQQHPKPIEEKPEQPFVSPDVNEYIPQPITPEIMPDIDIPDFSQMPDEPSEEISKNGVRKVALILGSIAATTIVLVGSMQSEMSYKMSERLQSLGRRVGKLKDDVNHLD